MAKHHYVPRFLLERFADRRDAKGHVWALEKESGRPFKTNPRNVAAISDFYVQDGEPEEAAEEAFARLESHCAALIERRVAEEEVSDQERADLAVFVGLTHMRTPLGRQWLKDMLEASVKNEFRARALFKPAFAKMSRRYEQAKGLEWSGEERERFRHGLLESLNEDRVGITAPPQMTLKAMFDLADGFGTAIYRLHWTWARAPAGSVLVLGDTPLSMYDAKPIVSGGGHGLRSSPNAETALPVDPELCLILTPEPAYGNARAKMTPQYVDELNLRSYAWAQRHIFGPSQQLVTAVRKRAKREKVHLARLAPRPPGGVYSVEWPEGEEMKQEVRHWQASPRVATPRGGGRRPEKGARS
jgi:Protein of unknown function (DUF4238)